MTDLMKDFTDIDAVTLGQLSDAERGGEGVKLPFPVLNAWVYNGKAANKRDAQTIPVLYFGGWATDNDELGKLVLNGSVPTDLDKWGGFEGAGTKGNTWNGRGTRYITAAFIASRARWIGQDGKAGPHFDKAQGLTRQHKQYLTMLYVNAKPWAYAVLSAKGWQTSNVDNAIKAWAAAIAPHRAALNAATLPLSAFALTVGTFGPEPHFKEVGSGNSKSVITPMEAGLLPDSAEKVAQRFIGAPLMRQNAERLAQAAEWLTAWGKGKDTAAAELDEAPVGAEAGW